MEQKAIMVQSDTELDNVVVEQDIEPVGYDLDSLEQMAEQAERRLAATNKLMQVALRITHPLDWVMVGGKPYLQESGATKVATLFGISWHVLSCDERLDNGYPAFTYTMGFSMGGKKIEVIGGRSGKDEFFGKNKSPDQIDWQDVKKAAYTNCLNRGIKTILPGLRNIDAETLKQQGINPASGYTFKEGTKGGKTQAQKNEGLVCAGCGSAITQKVASFSQGKFGKYLCMNCQKQPQALPTVQEAFTDVTSEDIPF